MRSSGRGGSRVPRRKPPIESKAARAHPQNDLAEARSAVADLGGAAGPDEISNVRMESSLSGSMGKWNPEFALEAFQGLARAVTAELDVRALVKPILETAMRTLQASRGISFWALKKRGSSRSGPERAGRRSSRLSRR